MIPCIEAAMQLKSPVGSNYVQKILQYTDFGHSPSHIHVHFNNWHICEAHKNLIQRQQEHCFSKLVDEKPFILLSLANFLELINIQITFVMLNELIRIWKIYFCLRCINNGFPWPQPQSLTTIIGSLTIRLMIERLQVGEGSLSIQENLIMQHS